MSSPCSVASFGSELAALGSGDRDDPVAVALGGEGAPARGVGSMILDFDRIDIPYNIHIIIAQIFEAGFFVEVYRFVV